MTTTTNATATTTFGALQSDVDGGTIVFRGIPYAPPSVGGLRFTPPRTTEQWAVLWLNSEAASFMAGVALPVDCGLVAR